MSILDPVNLEQTITAPGVPDDTQGAGDPSRTAASVEVNSLENSPRDLGGVDVSSAVSIGRLFILTFRWILLLLVALTVEKGIDALTVKITSDSQPFYLAKSIAVSLPIIGDSSSLINWAYLCGILQALVIFMLMFRYFLCLIEPITEVCRTNGNINFQTDYWQLCLKNVKGWRIALVLFASTLEFLFLIQASLALPNVRQWLSFLVLLALFDLCVFIVMPVTILLLALLGMLILSLFHSLIEGGSKIGEEIEAILGSRILMWLAFALVVAVAAFLVIVYLPAHLWICVLLILMTCLLLRRSRHGDKRREWLKKRFGRLVFLFKDLSREWAVLYLGWDLADLAVTVGGLLLITVGGYSDEVVIGIVFVLVFFLSMLNMRMTKRIYKQHLSVLTLATER
jgi:hypothetical protein